MLDKFKEKLYFDFPDIADYTVYLAISGGKDSMALSHLLNLSEINHELLHCNFQLRGNESDLDEEFLVDYAANHGLKIHTVRFDTYTESESRKKSIQKTARDLRYEWFKEFKTPKSLIMMAHHLDDAIETFFINLLRGTGVKGINGIPNYRHPFYRPLLNFTTHEILSFIDENGIDYREDSSNSETKYLRNNIRHNLLPQLLELEPSFKKKMNSFFEEMNLLSDVLEGEREKVEPSIFLNESTLDKNQLLNIEPYLIQLSLSPFGIKRSNLNDFISFLKSETGSRFITSTFTFLMNRSEIEIEPHSEKEEIQPIKIHNLPFSFNQNGISCLLESSNISNFIKSNNPLFLDKEKIKFPLIIRVWTHGDRINPFGMKGSKLVSDVLIDQKISLNDKMKTLVLLDAQENILAIPGIMISNSAKIENDTVHLLKISVSK